MIITLYAVQCAVCTHTRSNSEIQYAEKPAQEIASVANSFQDFSADQMENSATTEKVWTPFIAFLGLNSAPIMSDRLYVFSFDIF